MLDLGWTELLVIGVVALIVVGPKDLPVLFRNVGRFVGKARGMAREFSRAMNEAADDSGMRDAANTFKSATNPLGSAMDGVKDAARRMTDPTPGSKDEGLKKDPGAEEAEKAERAEQKRKIEAGTARAAADRQKREAEAAAKRAEEAARKADDLEAGLKKDDQA
ncbi:Sec-independent protein translocase protein TatB [Salipiger mucosus]|uniref:Sec-independent protein translocase protein TatB n=1 Tax=Salipiger mucosus DSM 16094 TaxID=1123237 RepID=S9QQG4_9RHOB|nr:Sec-independent protein translocase protein TatB [Salipiger mucosus]EPX81883.1 Twin-arginine translocation protein TatB [Salipiger mucosus DSM 16094]